MTDRAPDPPPPRQTDRAPTASDVGNAGRTANDHRSSISKGVQWASVGTTIALEMAGAPLIGYLLDRWLDWFPWLTFSFLAVGFWLGVMQLIDATKKMSAGGGPRGGMR